MGRTMKRVPMDFDWPLGKVWKGFINPYKAVKCPYCYSEEDKDSTGETLEAREYEKTFYGFKMRCNYIQHPYHNDWRYCPEAKPYKWEQWEYDFIIANDGIKKSLFGNNEVPAFDKLKEYFLRNDLIFGIPSDVQYALTEEYCRRNGYEYICKHCEGTGMVFINEEFKRLYDEFKGIEPPEGDGYQLWETTSEGSPKSPVFATFEELCEWCAENATTFADFKATKEEWSAMLDDDFVHHKEGNCMFI